MPSDRLSGFSSAFDELLERSRRELDALSGGSGAPALSPTSGPSSGSPASSSATARSASPLSARTPVSSPASRSQAVRALDEKLGADWRYEVLERTREGDELVVRCRVTAPSRGVSRTWYGAASMSGAGRDGASGRSGTAGNVRFTVGAGTGSDAKTRDPIRAEREAERRAVESALAACARLL